MNPPMVERGVSIFLYRRNYGFASIYLRFWFRDWSGSCWCEIFSHYFIDLEHVSVGDVMSLLLAPPCLLPPTAALFVLWTCFCCTCVPGMSRLIGIFREPMPTFEGRTPLRRALAESAVHRVGQERSRAGVWGGLRRLRAAVGENSSTLEAFEQRLPGVFLGPCVVVGEIREVSSFAANYYTVFSLYCTGLRDGPIGRVRSKWACLDWKICDVISSCATIFPPPTCS